MTDLEKALALPTETEIVIRVTEIIWRKTKASDHEFTYLTEPERTIIHIGMLEGEVNNGGFDQFFFNSSGDHAHEVLVACKLIGALRTAELVANAIECFPMLPIPKSTEVRRQAMQNLDESISEKWSMLDGEFYKYEDDISVLLIEYIKANQSEIG